MAKCKNALVVVMSLGLMKRRYVSSAIAQYAQNVMSVYAQRIYSPVEYLILIWEVDKEIQELTRRIYESKMEELA